MDGSTILSARSRQQNGRIDHFVRTESATKWTDRPFCPHGVGNKMDGSTILSARSRQQNGRIDHFVRMWAGITRTDVDLFSAL
ncbi:hypothetical protein V2J23_07235 [Geobacillus thermoleovorans]|uniref:hypothetical protein n=1 Tax=Geobacillus thermoleovorans TaxID=33941 RepID=UPI00345B6658